MRRIVITVGLVVAGAGLLMGTANAQQSTSATVGAVGWWTDRSGAEATGAGGFEVAASSQGGDDSVAAIQITFGSTQITKATVTLTEESNDSDADGINACVLAGAFSPANPGALADAPTPNCDNAVALTKDGTTWSGDITSLVAGGGTKAIMFMPDYAPPTLLGFGMVVRIASVQVSATGVAPTTTAAPSTTQATSPPTTQFVPPPTTQFVPPPTTAFEQAATNLVPEPPPVVVTLPDAEPTPLPADDFFTLGEAEEFPEDPKPWIRLAILIPASLGLGYGAIRGRDFLAERSA